MLVTIRLYKKQDFDLLALYFHPLFDFKKNAEHILHQYAHGIYQPLEVPKDMCVINRPDVPMSIQIQLNLNEKTDESTTNLIKNIMIGFRNNFIKNIIRAYCSGFHSQLYMKDPNYAYDNLRTTISAPQSIPLASEAVNNVQIATPVSKQHANEVRQEKKKRKTEFVNHQAMLNDREPTIVPSKEEPVKNTENQVDKKKIVLETPQGDPGTLAVNTVDCSASLAVNTVDCLASQQGWVSCDPTTIDDKQSQTDNHEKDTSIDIFGSLDKMLADF